MTNKKWSISTWNPENGFLKNKGSFGYGHHWVRVALTRIWKDAEVKRSSWGFILKFGMDTGYHRKLLLQSIGSGFIPQNSRKSNVVSVTPQEKNKSVPLKIQSTDRKHRMI